MVIQSIFCVVMSKSNKIILVDGSSYLFRAFHALPQLTNSQGEPTGAIFGVINMLKKLKAAYPTNYIAVVFDAKGKNFRHDLYPQYKANRKAMADELCCQVEPLYEIIRKLGYPLISIPKVEADDVIGSLAQQFSALGHEIIIATGDKDMAQLVNDKVTLIDTMKNQITDIEGVIKKFGVTPSQIIDYLALVGDASDNIPGVPNVGPKTAVKWLNAYQNLQGVIDNAHNIAGKVGQNLRDTLEKIPLSYQLATIKCDLDLSFSLDDITLNQSDISYLRKAFTRYELRGLLNALENDSTANNHLENPVIDENKVDYQIILDLAAFEKFCYQLSKSTLFAFDTETNSLDTFEAKLVGISFALKPFQAFYIPLQHDYEGAPPQLNIKTVTTMLKPILENANIKKIAQNAKFDLKILNRVGIAVEGLLYDTMLESYIHNSASTRHDLDTLAKKYLSVETLSFEALAGKGKKQLTFNQIEINKAGFYAAEDADITYRLHDYFWPRINAIAKLRELYLTEELPVSFVIDKMERAGVNIDCGLLKQQSQVLGERIADLAAKCIEISGQAFNLSSTKQLREILYDKMKLPILKRTPGGHPSTAEEVLQELAAVYELPKIIIEHRHLSKLKSTYTDKLPLMVNKVTHRVHTSYHQAVASTGRLSSSDPNLQNIPIRSDIGRRIREAFIAKKGYKILSADYSQVELRIMAHLSEDATLLKAFQQGLDIHTATAAETLGIKLSEVSSEQRRRAKAVNFGLIYGMGAFGLAKQLGIARGEAQAYIDVYFSRYPGIKNYIETAKYNAGQHGFVETLFGRRLYLPDISSRNVARKRGAERIAINAPMQGSAADIIKRAMIQIDHWMIKSQLPVTMIMQVHDELVFEVKEEIVDAATANIKALMESAGSLKVPLIVDIGIGNNWDQAH